jgi:hypothetical protein
MEHCKWHHGREDCCKIVLGSKSTTAEDVNYRQQVKGREWKDLGRNLRHREQNHWNEKVL